MCLRVCLGLKKPAQTLMPRNMIDSFCLSLMIIRFCVPPFPLPTYVVCCRVLLWPLCQRGLISGLRQLTLRTGTWPLQCCIIRSNMRFMRGCMPMMAINRRGTGLILKCYRFSRSLSLSLSFTHAKFASR